MQDILFSPFSIGKVRLDNRIVMAPMTRNRSPGGVPNDAVIAYYRRRAEAGVGLIVTEGVGIQHGSALGGGSMKERDVPFLYGDAALAGWRAVVDAVHGAGGRIFPQLWHMGPIREDGTGPYPQVPSSRPSGLWGPAGRRSTVPDDYVARVLPERKAMTDGEIADVIAAFADAARNAVLTGFDGIAIHGAHGYLIDSFLWAETNRRNDRWGGDLAGRSAFAAAVVSAIRGAVGGDVPIMFRFSQWKQQDYQALLARTPGELETMLRPLVDAGVDIFDASTRKFDMPAFDGSDLTLAGWARQLTGLPAMAVGGVGLDRDLYGSYAAGGSAGIDNLAGVRRRMTAGEFDLIGVGRALIADPQWARKAERGESFLPFDPATVRNLV
ncbi:12-oxophytodienoate reductase [Sphingobium baderi]|uniref:1,2-oxophytodienoate reductase n=1 Tax=Sphingobium baderi TaxID=1332080 RepID=A0A0S3F5H3_9SPHN|nr:12-oxophytodienoate reductase [Sphingobium baderi]ALR22776.1 1,2-oxophytodienoate reductase [Sphingobium baderi]